MSKAFSFAMTALLAGALLATPALAADKSKAKGAKPAGPTNEELLRRIESLEQRLQDQQIQQGSRINTLEQKTSDIFWEFANGRPIIKTGDGRFELAVRGRFHFDVASYMQDDSLPPAVTVGRDLSSGAVFRRSQFGVEGKFFRDFQYEFRYEFGGSDTEGSGSINIMRVAYTGIPGVRLNIGAIQPIFTMADTTSSNDIPFMERAGIITMIVDAFGGSDSRRAVELTYQKQNALWQGDNIVISGAYSGQKIGTARGNDEGTYALGRVAWRLFSNDSTNIQIGASGSTILSVQGGAPAAARVIQLRERPELRVDGTRLIDTGTAAASMAITGGNVYGFEGGANWKNFYVGGEWYRVNLERDRFFAPAGGSPSFDGWYAEASWILTGESRRYAASATSNSYAVFGAPRPASPFSLGGTIGALELTGRYSVLDLNWNSGRPGFAAPAGGIRGGVQQIWTVGLNWYLNNNVRFMVNYQFVDIDRLNAAGLQSGQQYNALGARAQLAF